MGVCELPTSVEHNEMHADLVVGYWIRAGSVGVIASTIIEFIVKPHSKSWMPSPTHFAGYKSELKM